MYKLATAVATVLTATALTTIGVPALAQESAPIPASCIASTAGISKEIKAGYSHQLWRQGPDQTILNQVRDEAICLTATAGQDMQQMMKKAKSSFFTYRTYRRIAKIPGFHEGDEYLEWLPIPRYIVACETRGRYGQGRWTAHNPSTNAQGPAQLNGWPAPDPAKTDKQKLAYWKEVIRGPLASQGLGAWSCA